MPLDIRTLLFSLTLCMVAMAVALPAVMERRGKAARCAQAGVVAQGLGWALLLFSGFVVKGSLVDRLLSTLAMAGISGGFALSAAAFDLWCGRPARARLSTTIAVVMPLGYAIGFSSYPFRVGWANLLLATQMALIVVAVARRPAVPVGRWRWLVIVCVLIEIVPTVARGVLGAFFTASYPTFLYPHPANVAFAVMANVAAVLSLMAMLLAHRDEISRDLERLATVDGLTGVFNRRAWMAAATTELAMSVRYGHPVAVLMIDIDHFKAINDARGHDAGDRALVGIAAAITRSVRPGDLVGRYGGEEFCVLMSHADHPAAVAFDVRLRAALAATVGRELGFAVGYSAGIAMRQASDDTLDAMLKRADAALYGAKAQGRSRTVGVGGHAVAMGAEAVA